MNIYVLPIALILYACYCTHCYCTYDNLCACTYQYRRSAYYNVSLAEYTLIFTHDDFQQFKIHDQHSEWAYVVQESWVQHIHQWSCGKLYCPAESTTDPKATFSSNSCFRAAGGIPVESPPGTANMSSIECILSSGSSEKFVSIPTM